MTKRSYKRRRYVVSKDFQSRFILKSLFMIFLSFLAAFAAIGLYFYFEYGFPGGENNKIFIQVSHGVTVESISNPLELILPPLVIGAILVMIVVFFWSLVYSNRIAGPLYRFRMVLLLYKRGDYSIDVILRKKDEFKDFAEEMNRYARTMRKRIMELERISRER